VRTVIQTGWEPEIIDGNPGSLKRWNFTKGILPSEIKVNCRLIGLISALAFVPFGVRADLLPATWQGYVCVGANPCQTSINSSGTHSAPNSNSSVTETGVGTGVPSITMNATTSGTGAAAGYEELRYFFTVNGPATGTSVDVNFLANASVTGTPFNGAGSGRGIVEFQTSFGIDNYVDFGTGKLNQVIGSGVPSTFDPASFTMSNKATLTTGTVYTVYLRAWVYANGDGAVGTAYIDPYIFVDLTTPNAGLYTVTTSPEIGNDPITAAVPEPSTWAMMLLGFAGVGYMTYRRRRTAAPAT
jgi:hypothetical protein